MADDFDREFFDSDAMVFQWGDPGESAYVIEDGCVEVLAGEAPHHRRLALLTQGAMFGEVALLDRQPRTASVRAVVPTRLIRIDRGHVEELLARSDPVIQYLLRLLLARFRSSHDVAAHRPPLDSSATEAADGTAVDLHRAAVRTLSLAQDLSDSIGRGQLELYYQPLIALKRMDLAGYEALIRWNHPTLGLVKPEEFIPLAEKTGLIHRIGHWVLQRSVADWAELREFCTFEPTNYPFMSINLSSPELADGQVVHAVERCLRQHQMDARELRIELTETTIIENIAAVSATLNRLRTLGTGIALDDFGTGYAGLDYLQSLPVTSLKIDKTFVQQINQSQRSVHIIRAALELARSFGMTTVAEGIEDAEVGVQLAEMGCTYGQGFCYAKPMPKKAVAAWVLKHRSLYRSIHKLDQSG